MRAEVLIDTNILVYAYDLSDIKKRKKAMSFLTSVWNGEIVYAVSLQNLAEFYTVVTKKIEYPISPKDAQEIVHDIVHFKQWDILVPDQDCLLDAMRLSQEYNIHFWDAYIAATAMKRGIKKIITENISDFKMPEIRAINPFI